MDNYLKAVFVLIRAPCVVKNEMARILKRLRGEFQTKEAETVSQ